MTLGLWRCTFDAVVRKSPEKREARSRRFWIAALRGGSSGWAPQRPDHRNAHVGLASSLTAADDHSLVSPTIR